MAEAHFRLSEVRHGSLARWPVLTLLGILVAAILGVLHGFAGQILDRVCDQEW